MLSRLQSRCVSAVPSARAALSMATPSAAAALRISARQQVQAAARVPVRAFTTSKVCWAESASAPVPAGKPVDTTVRASSIVITAAGPDRAVSAALQSAGANLEESRMTILGNDFAILLRVTVPEAQTPANVTAALQAAFPEFLVAARNTTTHPIFTSPMRIFSVAVEGPDQPGIVAVLSKLFLQHNGSIRDLDTDSSNAPFAGYKIFSLKCVVALPINADFASFEESLHKFEDEYGFDVDVNEGMNGQTEGEEGENENENENEGEEEEPEQEEEDEEEMRAPARRSAGPPPGRGPASAAARGMPPPAAPRRPSPMDMGPPPPRGPPRPQAPTGPSPPRGPPGASQRGPASPRAPTGPSRGPVRK